MRGLYNGMELILSTFESREPIYWPEKSKNEMEEQWMKLVSVRIVGA